MIHWKISEFWKWNMTSKFVFKNKRKHKTYVVSFDKWSLTEFSLTENMLFLQYVWYYQKGVILFHCLIWNKIIKNIMKRHTVSHNSAFSL